ncbi:MAG: hypothetical protein VZQ61_01345 [Christensenellaceae bacterium]
MKSRVITVSAISAGLVSICLALGVYVGFADVFALILSSVFVILPLYVKSYKGCVMTYLVGGTLGLIFGWFNFLYSFVFPAYFAFFGLFPIVNAFLKDKKLKKYILHIIGLLWCVAAFYGIFLYYTFVMGLDFANLPEKFSWLNDYAVYAVGVFSVIFYFIYDRFLTVVRALTDRYLGKNK